MAAVGLAAAVRVIPLLLLQVVAAPVEAERALIAFMLLTSLPEQKPTQLAHKLRAVQRLGPIQLPGPLGVQAAIRHSPSMV